MNKARIGLIGCGWMGAHHGRNVAANGKAVLAGVCDENRARAEALCRDAGITAAVHGRVSDLLTSEIDAVIIASPNSMHADMCVAAAKAGKHIYCEKPMAITLPDCKRVRAAVEKAGVKYLIGYHRRLNPLYQYARGLLSDGKLGHPFMIESDYIHHVPGDWDSWSWLGKEHVAGSIFHAGCGHNVDLIRYFCGDVVEVSCMKGTFLPRKQQVETEDTAIAIFRFASGAIGKVQCCVGPIAPFRFTFTLYGTQGTVINNRVWLDSIPRFADAGHEHDCIELPESWIPDNVQGGIGEPWNKLIDHFVDMLVNDVPCLNDVQSAYKTSVACFAAMKAAATGRAMDVKKME